MWAPFTYQKRPHLLHIKFKIALSVDWKPIDTIFLQLTDPFYLEMYNKTRGY